MYDGHVSFDVSIKRQLQRGSAYLVLRLFVYKLTTSERKLLTFSFVICDNCVNPDNKSIERTFVTL